jgi:hypothetical protein
VFALLAKIKKALVILDILDAIADLTPTKKDDRFIEKVRAAIPDLLKEGDASDLKSLKEDIQMANVSEGHMNSLNRKVATRKHG